MKIKALVTIPSIGLIKEAIYDTEFPQDYKESLCGKNLAVEVFEDELEQTVIDIYTPKAYPNRLKVIKDNAIYKANVGEGNFTSNTWVLSEWELLLQGA